MFFFFISKQELPVSFISHLNDNETETSDDLAMNLSEGERWSYMIQQKFGLFFVLFFLIQLLLR